MREPKSPSVGKTEVRVSGGVCTGVIVTLAWGALAAASREDVIACIVSLKGFAERGLGSFPGGDESVLVNGVSALRAGGCPGCAILVLADENMDDVVLDTELAEPTPFKRPSAWLSLLSGRYVEVMAALRLGL